MKAIILAAGKNEIRDWPALIDKPKCLYAYQGQIQLARVIETLKHVVSEEDIIIVAGYKAQKIREFIKQKEFNVRVVENEDYEQSALFSLKAGLDGINDDILLLLADENITVENLQKVAAEKNRLVCLVSDHYPYYCLNVFKVAKESVHYFTHDRYLAADFLHDVKAFLTNNLAAKSYDLAHLQSFIPTQLDISSGFAMGFMCIDIIRRIGQLDEVIQMLNKETPSGVTTVPYNESQDYIADLDNFCQTDEYQNSLLQKYYFDGQTNLLRILGLFKRLMP